MSAHRARQLRRVSWLLFNGRDFASSRLQGYAIHEFLVRRGLPSTLLSTPPFPLRDAPWDARHANMVGDLVGGEIVVLQKLSGPRTLQLARALRRHGTSLVYAAADYEPDNIVPLECDIVICSSSTLAEHWSRAGANATNIPDAAEFWRQPEERGTRVSGDSRLRLCWIGHRKNWMTLDPLRRLIQDMDNVALVTVSNHAEADVAWSPAAVEQELVLADAVVVPTRSDDLARYASENRVVQAMAAGKPVVAGRIPAYEQLIVNGHNGFVCASDDDWRRAVTALRDPVCRNALALAGWETARPRFHIDAIGVRWLETLECLRSPFPAPSADHVRKTALGVRVQAAAHVEYAREALRRNLGLRVILSEAVRGALRTKPAVTITGRALARAVRRRIR